MRKNITLALIATAAITITVLVSIIVYSYKTKGTAWLEGKWYSNEWRITYNVKNESKNNWSITQDQHKIAEGPMVVTRKASKSTFIITDKTYKTKFVLTKRDAKHMTFQQQPSKGLLGTTNVVSFVKK